VRSVLVRWPGQVVAFARKELADVLRQPRTLLVMVLGPFLIMAGFGLGYEESPPSLRIAFVVQPDSPLHDQVVDNVESFDGSIDVIGQMTNEVVGIFDDVAETEEMIRDGEVDVVVVFPSDPVAEVLDGERATVTVIHTRLDPIERTAIWFVSQAAIDEINAQLLADVLDTARGRVGLDTAAAVDEAIDALPTGIDEEFVEAVLAADPHVLVRPLDRDVELAVSDVDDVTDWYAPAAIVLMLQQLGVALGALAFVRERGLGIDEVYAIAPVGGSASVLGKYLAYVGVGTVIATALTVLATTVLGVPIAGAWGEIAVIVLLTLVAATGLGFLISLASRSEAQAVQYAMLVLLASLFFSGFFLSLDQMQGVARLAALALPATHGMTLLRDVMLRDAGLDPLAVGALAGLGLTMGAVVTLVTSRRMRRR
jgi:ABC-2 type transport system permease protein